MCCVVLCCVMVCCVVFASIQVALQLIVSSVDDISHRVSVNDSSGPNDVRAWPSIQSIANASKSIQNRIVSQLRRIIDFNPFQR